MDETYELIKIRSYWANNLESTVEAKLFADGRIEEIIPEYPEDDEEETQGELEGGEDEDE
jgi:hypothetical protein